LKGRGFKPGLETGGEGVLSLAEKGCFAAQKKGGDARVPPEERGRNGTSVRKPPISRRRKTPHLFVTVLPKKDICKEKVRTQLREIGLQRWDFVDGQCSPSNGTEDGPNQKQVRKRREKQAP